MSEDNVLRTDCTTVYKMAPPGYFPERTPVTREPVWHGPEGDYFEAQAKLDKIFALVEVHRAMNYYVRNPGDTAMWDAVLGLKEDDQYD